MMDTSVLLKSRFLSASPEMKFFLVRFVQLYGGGWSPFGVGRMANELGVTDRVVTLSCSYFLLKDLLVRERQEGVKGRPSYRYKFNSTQSSTLSMPTDVAKNIFIEHLFDMKVDRMKRVGRPASRLLLAILIIYSDSSGVVRDLSFSDICSLSCMTRTQLKSQLKRLLEKGVLRHYSCGFSSPVFSQKVVGIYFLDMNFIGGLLLDSRSGYKCSTSISRISLGSVCESRGGRDDFLPIVFSDCLENFKVSLVMLDVTRKGYKQLVSDFVSSGAYSLAVSCLMQDDRGVVLERVEMEIDRFAIWLIEIWDWSSTMVEMDYASVHSKIHNNFFSGGSLSSSKFSDDEKTAFSDFVMILSIRQAVDAWSGISGSDFSSLSWMIFPSDGTGQGCLKAVDPNVWSVL